MKKSLLLLLAALTLGISDVCAWGVSGHNAIAYIAECNLTPKAKKTIEGYLGHSIVYYSTWMDEYRLTPEYGFSTGWHTAPVDENLYYTDEARSPKGDAVHLLEDACALLKDYRNLDDSTVAVNLKYVIHLVADTHCPGHIKYPGQKNFDVIMNGQKTSYHSVWDSYVIDYKHRWSYTEWQYQLDRYSKKEKRALAAGTIRDWEHESAVYCKQIYSMAQSGKSFSRTEAAQFTIDALPIAEHQMIRAAYRLAKVLNELFG